MSEKDHPGLYGDFGKFQVLIILLLGIKPLLDGMDQMSAVFVLDLPDYRCENDTHPTIQNNFNKTGSACIVRDVNGTERKCTSWSYVDAVFNPSAAMEFSMVCDRTILRSTANMVHMLGLLAGALIGGAISDRFGRRVALLLGVALQSTGIAGTSLAPDIYTFITCRFVAASGILISYGAVFVFFTEIVDPSKRQIAGNVINLFYAFGAILVNLFAYLIRHWRHQLYAVASFHIIPLVSYWWIAVTTAFFGLSLNSGNLSGDLFVNVLVTCLIEVPAYLFALFAPMKFGRKAPHVFCMILGGVACLLALFVIIFADRSFNWLLIVLSTIGKFGASAAFASVYIYTTEINPTTVRNTTLGICSMCGRVGGLLAPFVADLGKLIPGRFSSALPLATFGAVSITAGILSLLLPETYAKPLPETIQEAAECGRNTKPANKIQAVDASQTEPVAEMTLLNSDHTTASEEADGMQANRALRI